MKAFVKQCVLRFLTALARLRLRRLRPFIIGVTGSVGKTSTKEAIYTILSTKYRIFRSEKSYNTELGLPLAILEQRSGFSSPALWLKTIFGALWKSLFGGKHIQILVLEMGADKPGDMDQLLKLVTPQVAVMTHIKPVHIAEGQFNGLEDIFREKSRLVRALPEKGIAVLNADDPYICQLKDNLSRRIIWYGGAEWADLRAMKIEESERGISFSLLYRDELADGELPLLGGFQIYVVMAAVAAALTQGFSLTEAVEALAGFKLPPGRMNPIEGMGGSTIIDSSYNASPESVKLALEVLKAASGRKIAVLGMMNELGNFSEAKHREAGRQVLGRADLLVSVGDHARWITEEAKSAGFAPEAAIHFSDAEKAAEYLKQIIKKGDTILVKGSQNKVRLERLVKAIMKYPERANELLARQGSQWEKVKS